LSGYARMDFRLTEDGRLYLLEPNPNPDLNDVEDFALAAHEAKIEYADLVQKIINLGFRYREGR
jgi:D-alanine-D-alanine ligase